MKDEKGKDADGAGEIRPKDAHEDRNILVFIENKGDIAAIVEIEADKTGYREKDREKGDKFPGHESLPNALFAGGVSAGWRIPREIP
jgi:hypothetical protein